MVAGPVSFPAALIVTTPPTVMPWAKGMEAVAVVCPSLQITVDSPVAMSAENALKTVELMTVPVTTG